MHRRGAFEEEEPVLPRPRRDTELTLGSGALLTIFLGLAFLCVFCFGLGYTVGHRTAQPVAALPAPSQPIEANNSLTKPPATTQTSQAQTADADGSAPPAAAAAPGASVAPGAQSVPATVQPAGASGSEPAVHPALVSSSAPVQPAPATPTAAVQPAMAQAAPAPAGSLMVQIAAVSQMEDATVLTEALRKRGYAVTARRDPADNLIHVRIGPFSTLAEANSWRVKLLGDGYNAVVQQ
jgi:DedD protein